VELKHTGRTYIIMLVLGIKSRGQIRQEKRNRERDFDLDLDQHLRVREIERVRE
jgi:hypothetical protein